MATGNTNQEPTYSFNLKVWRQSSPSAAGAMKDHKVEDVPEAASFLEMLDILNEQLVARDEEPIAFDYDCREGICGSCGCVVDGVPHGPLPDITVCQLHIRHLVQKCGLKNGDTITIEPWRANAFPVVKDLVVDRTPFDAIITSRGYVTVDTGSAPDANEIPIGKPLADHAFDFAACIGCGACVAACKNASAALFTGAKVSQLALLPQGAPERESRVLNMVDKMEELGFGACSNEGECEAVCPKGISTEAISIMIREYNRATLKSF